MENALYIVYTNRNEVSAALQRDPCERFYPFIYLFIYMLAIYWISRGWRCIALISGYICRFYDEDVKILKMIYIKNNKENTKEK